jgi:hypothetical protein
LTGPDLMLEAWLRETRVNADSVEDMAMGLVQEVFGSAALAANSVTSGIDTSGSLSCARCFERDWRAPVADVTGRLASMCATDAIHRYHLRGDGGSGGPAYTSSRAGWDPHLRNRYSSPRFQTVARVGAMDSRFRGNDVGPIESPNCTTPLSIGW